MDFRKIFEYIPEVRKPEEKKLDFKTKMKWTLIVVGAFFVLMNIPLFGLSNNALARFEYLATIMGTDFGSIISLGIGPIVMASIILQLLVGAQIINIDQSTAEGKKFFNGLQKLLVFFFIIFEATIYVVMQGLQALPGFTAVVIFQLILGGLAIFYLDDVCQKWGFGSGVSLFIAAGVSLRVVTEAFQFLSKDAGTGSVIVSYSGKVFVFIQSLINGDKIGATSAFAAILATVVIFLLVVWVQSLKVEIPLSFGRVRGYGIKWPLSFFYAGVIPVILTAALMAQIQMFGGILENAAAPCLTEGGVCAGVAKFASWFTWLGHFSQGRAISGFAFWMDSTNLLNLIITGGLLPKYLIQGLTHILGFTILSTLFAVLWIKTSQMDARAQAEKISASGLQLAGFRQDPRILEGILDRYIMPLTVMGGAAIGFLSSFTNLLGALVSGTSALLVIMIMFQLYQSIAQQHTSDMNPAFRKFMGG